MDSIDLKKHLELGEKVNILNNYINQYILQFVKINQIVKYINI